MEVDDSGEFAVVVDEFADSSPEVTTSICSPVPDTHETNSSIIGYTTNICARTVRHYI